jgi:hypothetical protein
LSSTSWYMLRRRSSWSSEASLQQGKQHARHDVSKTIQIIQ